MFYGKSRGQGRKYKRLLKYIAEIEPYIDKEEIEEWGFEHFHVPCPVWLDMPRTSSKIILQGRVCYMHSLCERLTDYHFL